LTRVGLSSDIRHSADAARRQRSVHQQLTHAIRDEFARWAPRLGPPAGATSLARAVVYPIAETMTSARLSGFSLSLLVLGGCNALEVANHWLVVAGPPGWDMHKIGDRERNGRGWELTAIPDRFMLVVAGTFPAVPSLA
jgi:hypothetical protein